MEEALARLSSEQAVWAEWVLDGQRAQIHVSGGEVQVFEGHGLRTKHALAMSGLGRCDEEVTAILAGNLRDPGDIVLEAVLMRPFGHGDEASAKGENQATKGEPVNKVHCVVIFDVLVLNGKALTRLPFRVRRAKLEATVMQTGTLRLVPGKELAMDTINADVMRDELVTACGASASAQCLDEKAVKARGVLLKTLDGPSAEYLPGLRVPSWQAIQKTPEIDGPEAEAALFEMLNQEERAKLPAPNDMHFCVISARRTQTEEGRQDILIVQRQFKSAGVSPRWYVDADSLEAYRALGLDAVVGGKLIPARNMALDDAEKLGKACVQASDDIEKWLYLKEQGGWSKKKSLRESNAAGRVALRYQVSPIAAAQFLLAKMRGSASASRPRLGGVLPHHNPGQSLRCEPVGTNAFILGDFFVVDRSPCRFDTRMTLKEDYDLTCAHLKTHGSVLRYNHLMVFAKHETNAGGACSVRDAQGERERENIRILQEKYPGAFKLNPKRPNQVVLMWSGHGKWLKENAKEQSQAASTG